MRKRYLYLSIFLTILAGTSLAQSPCSRILPITVVVQDGSIVKHLPAETLSTATKKISLQHDFTADDSSRRVLIVLDGASDLPKDTIEAEKWMARTILDSAREGDSFALISGNAVPVRVKPDAGNAAVLAAIDTFSKAGSGSKKLGLLDAIHEGLSWFGSPAFGDSVLLMASNTMPGGDDRVIWDHGNLYDARTFSSVESKIEPRELQNELLSRGTRVFSVVLGTLEAGSFTTTLFRLQNSNTLFLNSGTPDIISFNTGGFAFVHDDMAQGRKSFKFDDDSRKALSAEAMKIYGSIALIYRVSLQYSETKQMSVRLDLRPEIKSKLPAAAALHPRALPACTAR